MEDMTGKFAEAKEGAKNATQNGKAKVDEFRRDVKSSIG